MIDKGAQIEFGPRDEVLKKRTRNYPQLVGKQGAAAGEPDGKAPASLTPTQTAIAMSKDPTQ